MTLFGDRYRGCRVLLTGHTGFKGSWLALWLTELGAEVVGVALPPDTAPNHWDLLGLDIAEHRIDLRDQVALVDVVKKTRPDIVLHLAAQALVRRSYRDPLETWSTNVMGTAGLLEACRGVDTIRAIVVVTSDKCYENREWECGYRETDPLGGHDPYSASKAATELVAASYRQSFFHTPDAPLLATARAGNVVGGGDWSQDRLIPDLVRAAAAGDALEIRSPHATRPWQHVLESLSGYLLLGQRLLEGDRDAARSWNFGPDADGNRSVADILATLQAYWPELVWQVTREPQPHEATLLYLDSTLARARLGWKSVWAVNEALAATADWYRSHLATGHVQSRSQLAAYVAAAQSGARVWTAS
ncbi:MAG: CDP-glucose 4,6-dehydratase [Pseudomonadota bacterium]|nr:CDP-glucose 4,6-dehydratase [Pseudomonadota bacterium]